MFANINNQKIYYEKHGNGTPLIMIHGNGEDHTIFQKAVEKLKNHFTVFVMDSRGHGQSSKANSFHYSDMAEDVYCFIKEIIKEKPIYYGFSDGGIIGLLLEINHPNSVQRLIISGANTNPKGLKPIFLFGMKSNYFFSHSKLTKMMIKEPNITKIMLSKISVPTNITCGEHDMIKLADTKMIHENIKDSTLKIFKNELHGSYIVNSTKIADYIIEVCN